MEVTVLTVPHCPNAGLMDERLATAISGLAGVRVTRRVVDGEQQAAALGMRGSPTLLIGGTDPFADPASRPACLAGCTACGVPKVCWPVSCGDGRGMSRA